MTNITGGLSLEEIAPGVPELIASWCGWSRSEEDVVTEETPAIGSQTDILISYADEAELFCTPDQDPYGTFRVDDHEETWPIEGRRLELYLRRRYFEVHRKSPKAQPLTDAIATIAARAMFDGARQEVYVRLAGREDAVYVDLCNEAWEAVEITLDGWRVVSDPPVKFTRSKNSAPLPRPQGGGSIEELRPFVNVLSDADFKLIAFWLVGTLNPHGPYPLLEVNGERGSAKTTAMRVLLALTDPAVEEPRALPRDVRDLAIAARANWVLAFDNLSYITPQTSDALCRLATGGTFATRRLYTDFEEVLFSAMRPVLMSGINQVALRGDLLDRSLNVTLPKIEKDKRRTEKAFWADFEAARPRIFGAFLDAVSGALRNFEQVQLEELPRMADFAAWATASEEALGLQPGAFMAAYEGNRRAATEALLEGDPVAVAVQKLLEDRNEREWSGTSEALLHSLNFKISDDLKRQRSWPKAPNALSRRMNQIAPSLREVGIEYVQREEGRDRKKIKVLRKVGPTSGGDEGHSAAEGGGEPPEPDSSGAAEVEPSSSSDETGDESEPNDEFAPGEAGEPDYAADLRKLGWYRDDGPLRSPLPAGEINFRADPVARELRHRVPIDYGPHAPWHVPVLGPQIYSAEEAWSWEARDKTEEELRSMGWPASPEEMDTRLKRLIPQLQQRPYPFNDPEIAHYFLYEVPGGASDSELLCTKALLHAELWRNQETSEELFALVALRPGWSPPREEIEYDVWREVSNRDLIPDDEREITEADEPGGFVF